MYLRYVSDFTNCRSKVSADSALIASLSLLLSWLSLGVRSAIQRCHNQDGREQPGYGDGSQLPSVPIRRSADHLREHSEGDVLPANAHRSSRHKFYRRGGVDTVNRWVSTLASTYPHFRSCMNTSLSLDHIKNSWVYKLHLSKHMACENSFDFVLAFLTEPVFSHALPPRTSSHMTGKR